MLICKKLCFSNTVFKTVSRFSNTSWVIQLCNLIAPWFFLLVSSEQQNAEVFILLCQFHLQLEYNILMLQTYIFSVLWDKQKSGSRQQTKLYFVHLWLKYTAEWTLSSFSALGGALLSSQLCGKIAASTLCWILQPNLPTGAIIKLDKG